MYRFVGQTDRHAVLLEPACARTMVRFVLALLVSGMLAVRYGSDAYQAFVPVE